MEVKPRNFSVGRNRTLKVSPVFDTYWRFAVARQEMFMKRVHGQGMPWTDDPILAQHRFTNPYRASDRVSQYLIQNVIYRGRQTAEEVFFRTILFKIFNRIDTWELLESQLGELTTRSFSVDRYAGILDRAMRSGRQVYSAAYIMPSPSFGADRKHRNHLYLIQHMLKDGVPRKVEEAKSLRAVYKVLRSQPSLGHFLAFQFTIDLNYSDVIDFSEMDFVVAGPGAQNGIGKCFIDRAGLDDGEVIRAVAENAEREFGRLGLQFESLWGRPLQLIDCQNLFCEVDKYSRVKHPEFNQATSRSRIKQRYRPTSKALPQFYPPKWRLRVPHNLAKAVAKDHAGSNQLQLSLVS